MNNPFSISDDKLKILLKSYSEWMKNDPKEEDKNYADIQKQLARYLKETFLNKKYLGEISKDNLVKEIHTYSRKLEGPAFIRLGTPRITNNAEKIREDLRYLIDSPDDPIKKAAEILSGKYRISIFSKAFWTPIFQAQYPKILPNWNNKTERFLKIIGVNLKTTKKTTEEKYRLLSNTFVYLAQLDHDQDFYTLNHLMHYGTVIEEGKRRMAELLGSNMSQPTSFFEYLLKFLEQSESNNLNTSVYPNEYLGCKVKVGFGQGIPSRIPWIAFLRGNNRVSEGIYPVYLYYKNHQKLVLSYGISENNPPTERWKNTEGADTIADFFQKNSFSDPEKYGNSLVFKVYDINKKKKLSSEILDNDLEQIINNYKNNESDKSDTSLISLLTKAEILKEIFLEEKKFDQLVNLLENSGKKQIILQGSPGTGKTFIAQKIAQFLAQSKELKDRVEIVQFHPSYSYEDFIEGYRPTKDRGFELEEGIFKKFCLKARSDPQNKYVLIIDEINRGNLAKIFGELLYLLEYRKEEVKLTYSKEPFSIPENVYIIGTMNTADRSLAIMDYALRRRFYFLTLICQIQRLANWLGANGCECNIADLVKRLEELNKRIGVEMRSSDFTIGHSYFMKKNLNSQILKEIITFEVNPLLDEYFYDNSEKASELKKVLVDYAE